MVRGKMKVGDYPRPSVVFICERHQMYGDSFLLPGVTKTNRNVIRDGSKYERFV